MWKVTSTVNIENAQGKQINSTANTLKIDTVNLSKLNKFYFTALPSSTSGSYFLTLDNSSLKIAKTLIIPISLMPQIISSSVGNTNDLNLSCKNFIFEYPGRSLYVRTKKIIIDELNFAKNVQTVNFGFGYPGYEWKATGLALNRNNVPFQASTINLNTPKIKAIVSKNTINIMEHLAIEKKLSTNILPVDNTTDSNNIKITSLTIPGTPAMTNSDLSMNSETGAIKTLNGETIALSANTVTANSLSSGANESLYASLSDTLNLITMPPLGLNEQEQLIRLPSFQPYAITFPDLRITHRY